MTVFKFVCHFNWFTVYVCMFSFSGWISDSAAFKRFKIDSSASTSRKKVIFVINTDGYLVWLITLNFIFILKIPYYYEFPWLYLHNSFLFLGKSSIFLFLFALCLQTKHLDGSFLMFYDVKCSYFQTHDFYLLILYILYLMDLLKYLEC